MEAFKSCSERLSKGHMSIKIGGVLNTGNPCTGKTNKN
jgi:hypothetical protein